MFNISKQFDDYGMYLKDCISQEDIDFIVSVSKDTSLPTGKQRAVSYVEVSNKGTIKGIEAFNKIHPVIKKALEVYAKHFNINIEKYTIYEGYLIKTWHIGIGIGPHSDIWESKDGEPVASITIVLYLSSDYDGGEFVFAKGYTEDKRANKIFIKPEAGDILVFKSGISHWVEPVTRGTRIAVDNFYLK